MLEWAGEGAAVYGKLPAVDRVGCPPRPPADMNEACRCARLVVETRRASVKTARRGLRGPRGARVAEGGPRHFTWSSGRGRRRRAVSRCVGRL